MVDPSAAGIEVRALPRLELGAMRNLRRLLDTVLSSSDARSSVGQGDDHEHGTQGSTQSVRSARKRNDTAKQPSAGSAKAINADVAPATDCCTKTDSVGSQLRR